MRACVRACVRASVPYFLLVILQLFTSYLEIDEIIVVQIRSEPQNCGSFLNFKIDDFVDFHKRSETLQNDKITIRKWGTDARTHARTDARKDKDDFSSQRI